MDTAWLQDASLQGLFVVSISIVLWVIHGLLRPGSAEAADLYPSRLPSFGVTTRPLDGVNVSRGHNCLVVYTPSAGRATTGTDESGTEAIVEDGRVVRIGGNNHRIPAHGFVLSAHGEAARWLQGHLCLGARVAFKGNTLQVTIDDDAHYIAADEGIEYAYKVFQGLRGPLPLEVQEEVATLLDRAVGLLEAGDVQGAVCQAARARFRAVPSFPVEVRGVWHRPRESTERWIRETLASLQQAGFNAVFLEVFAGGYAIYPSRTAPQLPQFAGWDPLTVWADEAAKRNIELHLWVHAFRFGEPTIDRHPDWAVQGQDAASAGPLDTERFFGDPGHPEVQQYILAVLRELVEGYSASALHLDFIRYPRMDEAADPASFSEAARKAFAGATGLDVAAAKALRAPTVRAQWHEWQEQNVTNFVREVHSLVRTTRPEWVLSASVIADHEEAVRTTRQNWLAWSHAGWLDLIVPMAGSCDNGYVATLLDKLPATRSWIVPGLAPSLGLSPHQLIEQLMYVQAAGLPGAVLSLAQSLQDGHREALASGPYATQAAPPWQMPTVLRSLGTWIIEGIPRWVAEDILPADAALKLDEAAHGIVEKHGRGAVTEQDLVHWRALFDKVRMELDGPFYGQSSAWLQRQLRIFSQVLSRAAQDRSK